MQINLVLKYVIKLFYSKNIFMLVMKKVHAQQMSFLVQSSCDIDKCDDTFSNKLETEAEKINDK